MFRHAIIGAAAFAALALPQTAAAELKRVESRSEFVSLVQGKTLSRPLVKLSVGADGSISGRGVRWDVTGSWSWQNGYFCRDLNWGGDELGYNCQEVRANGRDMRFTSDQGRGESADFRLR